MQNTTCKILAVTQYSNKQRDYSFRRSISNKKNVSFLFGLFDFNVFFFVVVDIVVALLTFPLVAIRCCYGKVIFHANIDNGVKCRFPRWQVYIWLWEQRHRYHFAASLHGITKIELIRTVNISPQSMQRWTMRKQMSLILWLTCYRHDALRAEWRWNWYKIKSDVK